MSLTAFVTGASGFVGSHLVRELHRQGWEIHALARPTASLADIEGIPVKVHPGDVTDAESIRQAMPGDIDGVFHVAASTNFWARNNAAQNQVNIDGTRHMIQAAAAAGAKRFIHTSSFTTWGFRDGRIEEESPRTNRTDWINYVRSKHQAEEIVLEAVRGGTADALILNPTHILGPGDRRNWSRMIRMVQEGKMFAAPPGAGNFADVHEVARAHIAAFHHGRTGEKYLLGGEYSSFVDLVVLTGDVLGRKTPTRPAPGWIMGSWGKLSEMFANFTGREPDITPESAAMVAYAIQCDSDKARRELGYQYSPIRNLIEETAEWMRENGMLS